MKINEKELEELRNKALSCDSRGAAITISARLLITLIDEREAAQPTLAGGQALAYCPHISENIDGTCPYCDLPKPPAAKA